MRTVAVHPGSSPHDEEAEPSPGLARAHRRTRFAEVVFLTMTWFATVLPTSFTIHNLVSLVLLVTITGIVLTSWHWTIRRRFWVSFANVLWLLWTFAQKPSVNSGYLPNLNPSEW